MLGNEFFIIYLEGQSMSPAHEASLDPYSFSKPKYCYYTKGVEAIS